MIDEFRLCFELEWKLEDFVGGCFSEWYYFVFGWIGDECEYFYD